MSTAAPEPRTRPPGADLRLLVPLRPQGPIEVIDRATHVLRTRIADVAAISLAVQVPLWLVLALVLRDQWARGLDDNAEVFWFALFPEPSILGIGANDDLTTSQSLIARVLPSLGLTVIGAALGVLVRDWSRGVPTRGAAALGEVLRRGHLLLALWAIVHLIEVVTCVGLVLGPLVFGAAAPLFSIERLGPWSTVRRSWRLSIRRFWPLCVSIPVATLVSMIIGGALGALGIPIVRALTDGWVDVGGTAATTLAAAVPRLVLDALLATSMALIALDLKVQVEGYDIEVELGGPDARGAGA